MIQAVGYLRVSSEGQLDGYGLDAQEDEVREYAASHGYELVEIFREEAVKGATDADERVAFVLMMDFMQENGITTVIIPRLNRLARRVMVQEKALNDIQSRGWTILSVHEPDLGSSDPERVLFRQIIGAFNEYDRSMIVARMKAGRVAKAKRGGHAVGRVPLGYESVNVDGRQTLVKNDAEAEIVQHIFRLKDGHKLSFQAIADWLNEHDYRPKTWTPEKQTRFFASTVHKIYNNPKYRGLVVLQENGTVLASAENDALKIVD